MPIRRRIAVLATLLTICLANAEPALAVDRFSGKYFAGSGDVEYL